MSLVSTGFLVFLLVGVIVYYLIPKKAQWAWLLILSYAYYLCSGYKTVVFILLTTIVTFTSGILLERTEDNLDKSLKADGLAREDKKALKEKAKTYKKRVVVLALLLVFGVLAVVKYHNFAIENVNGIIKAFGGNGRISTFTLLLPLGISFYSFQSISYVIDVYRGKVKACNNIFKYALFVSYFPQITQGPIGRYDRLAPQFLAEHKYDLAVIQHGLQRMAWGLFKKFIIADRAGVVSDLVFNNPGQYHGIYVIIGVLAYCAQLYGDFAGGIDMVMGASEMFGIHLDDNFRQPFFSHSIGEFWRRWHMTLGGWFRDYLYIPLGGNRVSVLRWCFNMFVVWLLSGLWHGAGWNFALWGLYFGVFLSAEKLIGKKWKERSFKIADISANNDSNGGNRKNMFLICARNSIEHGYVLLVVLFSFVIFRAESVREIKEQFLGLSGCYGNAMTPMAAYEIKSYLILLLIACAGATPFPAMWVQRLKNANMWKKSGWLLQSCYILTGLVLATAFLLGSSVHPFLYFRF